MVPVAKHSRKSVQTRRKGYWQNELKSLGIEPNRQNELNDKEELQALAEIIKEVYFQDYKTAYSGDINENNINRVNNITVPHPKKRRASLLLTINNDL